MSHNNACSQLATSDNELASGLGQFLEALRLISALPRASPVFVMHTPASSHVPTTMAFGRDHPPVSLSTLMRPQTVITLIKTSPSSADPIHLTIALCFREDGKVNHTAVLIDEGSRKELALYVHTLHVEDNIDRRPSIALSTLSGTVISVANGITNGNGDPEYQQQGFTSNASMFVLSQNAFSIKFPPLCYAFKVDVPGTTEPAMSHRALIIEERLEL